MSATDPEVTEVTPLQALAEDAEPTAARPRPGQVPPAPAQDPIPEQQEVHPFEAPDPNGPESEEPETAKPRSQEDMEILAPTERSKQWKIGAGDLQREYVQRELSVIGKAQWFSLVGDTLDQALSGDNRLSLNSLLAPPQIIPGQPVLPQFADADTFVHAVGKLLSYSPDFISKSICIWLDVPDYEWDLVSTLMRMSPEEGGLSDDEFESMFAHFIDQNYVSIERFFRERFPRLRARLQARRSETQGR